MKQLTIIINLDFCFQYLNKTRILFGWSGPVENSFSQLEAKQRHKSKYTDWPTIFWAHTETSDSTSDFDMELWGAQPSRLKNEDIAQRLKSPTQALLGQDTDLRPFCLMESEDSI